MSELKKALEELISILDNSYCRYSPEFRQELLYTLSKKVDNKNIEIIFKYILDNKF